MSIILKIPTIEEKKQNIVKIKHKIKRIKQDPQLKGRIAFMKYILGLMEQDLKKSPLSVSKVSPK